MIAGDNPSIIPFLNFSVGSAVEKVSGATEFAAVDE
jgi:hypothetical protein